MRATDVHLEKDVFVLLHGLDFDLLSELDHWLEVGIIFLILLETINSQYSYWPLTLASSTISAAKSQESRVHFALKRENDRKDLREARRDQ